MKIVITGGGTGGHIYPGLAVAETLQDKNLGTQILFIGSEGGLEKDIIRRERYSLKLISTASSPRRFSYKIFLVPFLFGRSFVQSLRILKSFKPDIVFGTGGYASLPVLLSACFLKIPILIHEQNVIPGLANRLCGILAKKIMVSFEEGAKYFPRGKVIVTGSPVRGKILAAVKSVSIQKLALDQRRKTILVLGGSQGARHINEVIIQILEALKEDALQIIHVTGLRDYEWVVSQTENKILDIEREVIIGGKKRRRLSIVKYKIYHPLPYMYNIWDGLAAADLVISRAGGGILSEINSRGLPSILIPYPFATENHQEKNAEILKKAGAAIVIKNNELSAPKLLSIIKTLTADSGKLKRMGAASQAAGRGNAGERIVETIYEVLGLSTEKIKKRKKVKR